MCSYRIVIFHESDRITWSVKRLILAFSKFNAKAFKVKPSEFSCRISKGKMYFYFHNKPIENIDAAVIRSLGLTLSLEQFFSRTSLMRALELNGVFTVNPIDGMIRARNKFLSLLLLSRQGIKVPQTLITENLPLTIETIRLWGESVLKPIVGSLGFGSTKVSDADVAFQVAKTLLSIGQPLYIQEYIEKPQRDIRVFVVGDEVLGAIYRVAHGNTWKTNIAQGAKAIPAPRIPEVEEIAYKSVKILGLHYAGVDIVESKDGYMVLEVNSAPNWKGFQSATNVDPAVKIAEYVLKNIRK